MLSLKIEVQIEDITTDEIKALIREPIAEALQKLLDGSDWGKELKEEAKQR